jgi:hypothetical protein
MISDIRTAILQKVQTEYPLLSYKYYKDDIPQKFATPSFFISLFDHEYSKRISNTYSGTLSFDLAFYSEKSTSIIKSDLVEKQEVLMKLLDITGTFKILNKNAKITDNVLHITFDVKYSELKEEDFTAMQSQTTNTNI